jgi:hypothetical protein
MDAAGRPSTIMLKFNAGTRYEEARAASIITPGHTVELTADNEIVVQSEPSSRVQVATEEIHVLEGKTKDHDFAIGDLVSYRPLSKGDEFQAWLKEGEVVVIGDLLESAGDGTFVAADAGTSTVEAREAVDATAENSRIKVRVL